jgi:hypothetical protein
VRGAAQQDLELLLTELCESNISIKNVDQHHQRLMDMFRYLQQLTDLAQEVGSGIPVEPTHSLLNTLHIIERICRAVSRLLSTAADLQALSSEQQDCICWLADSGNMCVVCWLGLDHHTARTHIRQQVAQSGKCC